MALYFMNRIDDQGRFNGLKLAYRLEPQQADTHGASYLYLRKCYQEMGDIMGLDGPQVETLIQNEIQIKLDRLLLIIEQENSLSAGTSRSEAMKKDLSNRYGRDFSVAWYLRQISMLPNLNQLELELEERNIYK